MNFSYSKFQKFLLIFYLFSSIKPHCSAKLHNFNIVSGLMVFAIQVSLGEGTVISNPNASTPITRKSQDVQDISTSNSAVVIRDPRILKDLSKLNRQGCLAKMLCGIEVAVPPSEKYETTTLNDYAYLVKSFFDTFSFSGLTGTLSSNDDEPPPKGRGDKPSRKPSSADLYRQQSIKDRLENENIKKIYEDLTLEEMLGDDVGFRKRTGLAAAVPMNSAYQHSTKSQIKNPRFDKTMYLDRKQREFSMATDEAQKLTIAREVGSKFRRGRQCRALFNTGFSFCPWQAKDLQDILMNRTTYNSAITTTQRSYTLADSPYLYDSYTSLLNYQDDEYPEAFVNPSSVLVETDARETQINDSEGKGFLTYDPNTNANVLSYAAKPKKRSKKKSKKKTEDSSAESSSEEAKDIDSSENSKTQSSTEEEYEDGSVENEESSNHDHYEMSSDENTDPDSVESQDDEEEDHDPWSKPDPNEPPTTEKPRRKKKKHSSQKGQNIGTHYSVMKEALKFSPTKLDIEYMSVAQNFAKPNDPIVSQDRFRSGLHPVWDPVKEKWRYPQIRKQREPTRNDDTDDVKSKESESSEEDEENEDDESKELEEENHQFKEREQQRLPPPRPLIRFRLPKFRGRRSINYYTVPGSEIYLKRKPLPPEYHRFSL